MDAHCIKEETSTARAAQRHSIREQMAATDGVRPINERWFYLLIEPDRDLVRYVGIAQNPVERIGIHLHRGVCVARTPVEKWVGELASAGKIPRVRIVGRVQQACFRGGATMDHRTAAELVEESMIQAGFRHGSVCGMEADLLNVASRPEGLS